MAFIKGKKNLPVQGKKVPMKKATHIGRVNIKKNLILKKKL